MHEMSRFNRPELLEALRRRDRRAWEEFYEDQWNPLCAFIRGKLRYSPDGQEDIEDLAQEVLIRAYCSIPSFKGQSRLETWLRGIACHAIVDAVRATKLRREPFTCERVHEVLYPQHVPDPETHAVSRDRAGKIFKEVKEVLGPYSRFFTRRYVEELSEQQVAEAEGVKRGTASGYLSRVRTMLRQQRVRFASFL